MFRNDINGGRFEEHFLEMPVLTNWVIKTCFLFIFPHAGSGKIKEREREREDEEEGEEEEEEVEDIYN